MFALAMNLDFVQRQAWQTCSRCCKVSFCIQGSFKASTWMFRFMEDPDGAGVVTGEDARCLAKTELIKMLLHSV